MFYVMVVCLYARAQTSSAADATMTLEAQQERDQLRDALIAAQESAAVQILLELCLPSSSQVRTSRPCPCNLNVCFSTSCISILMCAEFVDFVLTLHSLIYLDKTTSTRVTRVMHLRVQESSGLLHERREVQSVVCTYLHQKFIADPALVKLVHFQVRLHFLAQ